MKEILSYKTIFLTGTVICSLLACPGCSNKNNLKYNTINDASHTSKSQVISKENYKNNYQEIYQDYY